MLRQLLLLVHLLGAIAWVGGMFFAYFCLRPAAVEVLDPPRRLPLWSATFARFLPYTALAVALMLASGLTLLLQIDLRRAPPGWHIMLTLGLVMTIIFGYVYAALYPRLRDRCRSADWPGAAQALNQIRQMVAVNLVLGVCTVVAAMSAR